MLTIGQTTLRPLAGFTLSDWLFLGAMCAALAGLAMRRSALTFRVPALIVLGVSLFVVSGLLSSFDAVAPLESAARLIRFAYLTLVWFWLGTLLLTKMKYLRTAIGMWVLSVSVDGVAAVMQANGVAIPFVGQALWGRMTGFTEQVNDLGGAAAVAMAPAFALIFSASRWWRQIFWAVALLFVVAAAVLSGSIGGMAAAIGAVGIWFVVSFVGVRPLIVAFAALALAAGVVQFQGNAGLPTPAQRLLAASGMSEGGRYSTLATRVQGYDAAWASLSDGGWRGVGLDLASANVGGGLEVHNVFLLAWFEAGWAAMIGMLCVVAGALWYALLGVRLSLPGPPRYLAAGLFASVTGFAVLGFSVPSPAPALRLGVRCPCPELSRHSPGRHGRTRAVARPVAATE